jgi:hypothetical protein
MATRTSAEGDVLFVGVQNSGSNPESAILSIYNDETLVDSRRLTIAAGDQENVNIPIPPGAGVIKAGLEPSANGSDYLPLDNVAWAMPSATDEVRVLLVTDDNLFLERFFTVLPEYEVLRARTEESGEIIAAAESAGDMFDLIVFDSMRLPEQLPDTNIMIVNPQPVDGTEDNIAESQFGELGIRVGPSFTDTMATRLAANPLLDNVDWTSVSISEAQFVEAGQLESVIETTGGPLLLAGEENGHRIAIFTFDFRQSDLPLQIAFPIVMTNITSWLSPGGGLTNNGNLQPGDPVTLIPDARAEAIIIDTPDGSRWEEKLKSDSRTVLFNQTEQTGLYQVSLRYPSGELAPSRAFVVNFINPGESTIRPVDSIRLGQTIVPKATDAGLGRHEVWPWLLALTFVILLVEWWVSYPQPRRKLLTKTQ